jgi:hypothetical protein
MAITGTQLISEGSGTGGYTVEYVDDAGAVVSVRFASGFDGINRTNAVGQAKMYLHRIVTENMLPDRMENGENQDGRAATIASSPNPPSERTRAVD